MIERKTAKKPPYQTTVPLELLVFSYESEEDLELKRQETLTQLMEAGMKINLEVCPIPDSAFYD